MQKKHLIIYDFDDENDTKWIKTPKNIKNIKNDNNENENDDNENDNNENEMTNFDIEIIDDKVRLSLEFNILINNKQKIISINVDIDKKTYLNIADKLK